MKSLVLQGKICPYCGRETSYCDSELIYGKSYGMMYLCISCNAWSGTHRDTGESLGRLANHELREAKKAAHASFDKLWRMRLINKIHKKYIKGVDNRQKSYLWLSEQLNIDPDMCHIGYFDIRECLLVIKIVENAINELNESKKNSI